MTPIETLRAAATSLRDEAKGQQSSQQTRIDLATADLLDQVAEVYEMRERYTFVFSAGAEEAPWRVGERALTLARLALGSPGCGFWWGSCNSGDPHRCGETANHAGLHACGHCGVVFISRRRS